MMRESRPRLAVGSVRAAGRWSARTLQEQVTVFVEAHEVVVRLEGTGEELAVDFARITGAGWREGVLSLHLEGEELQLQGGEALDRAWHTLTRRACTLPEVARAMRAFGGARGARAGRDEIGEARQRFFSPLMQARRRLEGEGPLEWLVAGFDTAVLAERIRSAVGAIATERHPASPPHRRALEARLLDACDPLLDALVGVDAAARALLEGDDAQRFVRWRAWAERVRLLFANADRSWRVVAAILGGEDRAHPGHAGGGRG